MKKTVLAIIFVMMLALAVTASAEVETFVAGEDGLYTINYDLSKVISGDVEDGTMFGMVVIEAAEGAEFALTEGSIRYIDQGEAEDGVLAFSGFAPMDLKEDGQYQVYIGGEGLSAATQIGILGEATEEPEPDDPEPPVVTRVPGNAKADDTVINANDSLWILRYLAGQSPNGFDASNADCNAHGNGINANDSLWILRYLAGHSVTLE